MATASFNDIRKKIQTNIDQSEATILVSVAWLTSKELLGQLIDKLESGCSVCKFRSILTPVFRLKLTPSFRSNLTPLRVV